MLHVVPKAIVKSKPHWSQSIDPGTKQQVSPGTLLSLGSAFWGNSFWSNSFHSEEGLGAYFLDGQLGFAAAAAAAPAVEGGAAKVERGTPLQRRRPADAHLPEHVVRKGPPRGQPAGRRPARTCN